MEYLSTAFLIICVTGGLVSLTFLLFASQIALWITSKNDAATIQMIRWLSVPIALSAIQSYLSGVLNGYRAIGRIALVQVANFGTMALLAFPFAQLMKAGHPLSLIGLLTVSLSTSTALAFFFVFRSGWMPLFLADIHCRFSRPAAKHFLRLACTMLLTGFVGAWIPLALRSLTARRFSLSGTGIFDVAWTISMAYVTLILTSFSTYYLPTLSQTTDAVARLDLVRRVLRISMILMVPLVVSIIIFKPLIIRLLYSSEFLPSSKIMRWMLIGDYFKVASWVFSFTMIAYADMKTYLWTEILWGGMMLGGAIGVITKMGSMQGIGVLFLVLYVFYLIYTFYYVFSRRYMTMDLRIIVQWLVGLALVISASAHCWNDIYVNWITAGIWMIVALSFSLWALDSSMRKKLFDAALKRFKFRNISLDKLSPL
jgi:PST family polysaccharide transporter